jgi:hypothetical protein
MGTVLAMDDPTNYTRALTRIRWLWRHGYFEIRPHAQQRMLAGKYDTTDIQHLFLYGRVTDHSHPGIYWRYVITGKTVDERQTRCVVEINQQLLIITIYETKTRRR